MINLTGGNIQNLAGLAQPNGSLTLQLNTDAVVIATPGFVPSAYQQKFSFGPDANLLGSCKIWSNAELNPPGTQYTATFRDANGARIASQIWQFIQTVGQTVDIGTIIPTAPASALAAVPFSAVAANLFFAGPGSGAAAFPTFRAMVANDLPAVVFFTGVTTAALSVSGNATVGGTLNKITITQPATGATLTIQDGTTVKGPASVPAGALIAFGAPQFQKFTASGTFTIPAGVTAVKVTVVGGGGAGGGASVSNTGAGGGSGGLAIKWLTGLTPGNTLAVTIGAGGTGVSNANGNNGSASTVASGTQTISTITANGGTGGQASTNPGPGGGAAISTSGDINGGGNPGLFITTASGFGGGGGGTFLGGAGSFVGSTLVGLAALANTGSGGGGAGIGATNAGGAGAAGVVIFEWVQ